MLEHREIMSGFKHLRSEFKQKCKIEKPLNELALWFTFQNDVLYVHDMEKHKTNMAIVICKSKIENEWYFILKLSLSSERLIKYAIAKNRKNPHKLLNSLYRSGDFMPFKFLK
jgi:hypothetical protein